MSVNITLPLNTTVNVHKIIESVDAYVVTLTHSEIGHGTDYVTIFPKFKDMEVYLYDILSKAKKRFGKAAISCEEGYEEYLESNIIAIFGDPSDRAQTISVTRLTENQYGVICDNL